MNAASTALSTPQGNTPAMDFRGVLDLLPSEACLLDRSLCIVRVNQKMAGLYGKPAESLHGRPLQEAMPRFFAQISTHLGRALAGEAGEQIEVCGTILNSLSSDRVFRVVVEPVRASGKETQHALLVMHDITEQRQAETDLRESQEHYWHSVELSPQIPWTAGPGGGLLEIGPRWPELMGMSREATLGAGWAKALHPDDRAQTTWAWSHALRTGAPADIEYRLRLADGSYRWFRARGSARRDAMGQIVRWYGTVEDIQDRKLAETALQASETKFRALFEQAAVGIAEVATSGQFLRVNRRLSEITGYTPAELQCLTFQDITHPDDLAGNLEQVRALLATESSSFETEKRYIGKNGAVVWVLLTVALVRNKDGAPDYFIATAKDVSERKSAEGALRRSEALARQVLQATPDCMKVLDLEGHLLFQNHSGAKLFEIESFSEIEGMRWEAVWPKEAVPQVRQALASARSGQTASFTAFCPTAKGTPKWWDNIVCPIPDADGQTVQLLAISRDISESKRSLDEVWYMARHDSLTGLANRPHFHEELSQVLGSLRQDGKIAMLYLDLDGFKTVNDSFGHPTGDALLCQVAERLRSCVRDGDTVARFGGDEFAILQTNLRYPETAAGLARRIITTLSEPYDIEGQQVAISTSIGVVLAPKDGSLADDLVRYADLALYAAKAAGRGTFRFFDRSMDEGLREKQTLKIGLRFALLHGGFELCYQPILDLRTDQVVCFEALLRLHHPERGLVSPAEFVPVAEEAGLILPIGEWVLREACREAAAWPGATRVAVNLSPVQFRDRRLTKLVAGILTETGLDPARLEIEITESVLLQDSEANLALLHALKKLGIRIAMDDFGTGYSSLNYLRRFPFDKIKIDRSFIADLSHSSEADAIVRAVLGLGKSLGIAVVAEGVETQLQLDYLRRAGCNQAQGYLISKPVHKEVAARLSAQWHDMEALAEVQRLPV